MSIIKCIILLLLLCIPIGTLNSTVSGYPASSFTKEGTYDWYDNWGIYRTYYGGSNGYLPNLASETLGENTELAYSIGEQFQDNYPSKTSRAVAILKYVQEWTEYGYDSDNVFRDGVAQDEWAWNADEMAHAFNEATGAIAIGDCEDMAFLCGTIYVGAGIDAAIIDAPEHVALLIWLPEFSNADIYWDLPNDDRDAGWIWVEATGESNPLGWTPPDFEDGGWTAYPIGASDFIPEAQPDTSQPSLIDWIDIDFDLLLAVGFVILSVLLALARAKRRR